MKYLVTGGCGFIGAQVTARLLSQGHQVFVVDNLSNSYECNSEATFIKADITHWDEIHHLFFNMDGCFHLAAIPFVNINFSDWFMCHQINLDGSLNVFKAAIEAGNVPIVYASSCAVYGNKLSMPLMENQMVRPISAYGCDKLSMEQNAFFLSNQYQLPILGLRLFNVYGQTPNILSPYSGVIARFIHQLTNDLPLVVLGDGSQQRDFIFIDDVVDHFINAMFFLKKESQVINSCTGHGTSINSLITLLCELLGKNAKVEYRQGPMNDVLVSYGSCKQMQNCGLFAHYNLKEGLIKTIDTVLQNKTCGKNQAVVCNKHLGKNVNFIQQMQDQLLSMSIIKEFFVCYQPQIEVTTQKIIGVEALLRWQSPVLGLIYPNDFIPLAEQSGLIVALGEAVLEQSCAYIKQLISKGIELKLAVNVSLRQIKATGPINKHSFWIYMQSFLKKTGFPPQNLELEITESFMVKNDTYVLDNLQKLKQLGVKIVCDDFGVGYSSFSRLKKLPLDVIKIDKSLIHDITNSKVSIGIVRAIVSIAQEMQIKTVAEGVEKHEQFILLKELGCDLVQGYYFSKPLSAVEFDDFIQAYRSPTL